MRVCVCVCVCVCVGGATVYVESFVAIKIYKSLSHKLFMF